MNDHDKRTTIGIVDYGMGNLQSVRNALERLGCEVSVSDQANDLGQTDALILPGVGAFGEAMTNLHRLGLVEALRRKVLLERKPLLGICLGMQLLADASEERGQHEGLSLIPGQVKAIPERADLRLPHMGWNGIAIGQSAPLFTGIAQGGAFYFVHSYHFECAPAYVAAVTDYGTDITAAVQRDHIFGVQFHPERSQRKGQRLLKNFVDFVSSTAADR